MKKITMICMAALLLLAASCKKEKEENNEPAGDEGTFRVETEVHSGDGKTHLDGASVVWDSGDAIKVINGNGASLVFSFSKYAEEGDHTVAEFTAENLPAGFYTPPYTGYYPSDFNPSSYSMPQTQTYSANGFVAGANPMIATNEPQKLLHFKNVLGILRLDLYGAGAPVKIRSITVRSKKASDKLWGSGSVVNGVFTVTSTESDQNVITLNCADTPVGTKKSEATSFHILLPAGTLTEGFDVTVTDKYGETWSRSTTNNNEIRRSRIRRMPESCVTEVQLWNGGPYWSTCNIGAETASHYGDYYQWAATSKLYETQPDQSGTGQAIVTFKEGLLSNGGYNYNLNAPFWKSGTQSSSQWSKYDSGNAELDLNDDVAYILTEHEWRIPTYDEFDDLISYTSQQQVNNYNNTGTAGIIFRSKEYSDRYIFIPYAGEAGYYGSPYDGIGTVYGWNHVCNRGSEFACWCNQLYSSIYNARAMYYYPYPDGGIEGEYVGRWMGCSIRPVKVKDNN